MSEKGDAMRVSDEDVEAIIGVGSTPLIPMNGRTTWELASDLHDTRRQLAAAESARHAEGKEGQNEHA